jgi:zinc transport system ATP-binding protein
MQNILEVKNLSIFYGQSQAVKDISFIINKGDFIGIAGPNGSGKTTLVKAILNLLPIKQGQINILGTDIINFKNWEKIGYLPQKSTSINNLFPARVNEIIMLGLLSTKKLMKRINKDDLKKVDNILNDLDINEFKYSMLSELSGGQQQKVLLARALVSEPEILIFDEPSTALDPNSRESFFELLKKINQEKNITIILITHDTGYIGSYANKLLYLDHELKYFGDITGFCPPNNDEHYFEKKGQHIIWHQHT